MLTTDAEAPVVTETTVSADLLEALEVLTELGVNTVGEDLSVLAVDNVALPVEEPSGDLVWWVLITALIGGIWQDVHCRGFWMMVTIRSSSSEVRSPARLVRSTSAFLQTKLE